MFGFSHMPELIIVLVIALVVFGPKRLPELGSSLGKGIREFRKATTELQDSVKMDTHGSLPAEQPYNNMNNYAAPTHTDVEYTAAPAQPQPQVQTHVIEPERPRV